MALPLIICWVLMSLGIVAFFACLFSGDTGSIGAPIIWMVLVGFFGFFAACHSITISKEYSIYAPDEIARSKFTVYVKYDGRELSSTEANIVMSSNEVIRVKRTTHINSYGTEAHSEWALHVQDLGE